MIRQLNLVDFMLFVSFRLGYAPGQTVNVNIYVSNESSCEVTDLEVQLNKVKWNLYLFSDIHHMMHIHFDLCDSKSLSMAVQMRLTTMVIEGPRQSMKPFVKK